MTLREPMKPESAELVAAAAIALAAVVEYYDRCNDGLPPPGFPMASLVKPTLNRIRKYQDAVKD